MKRIINWIVFALLAFIAADGFAQETGGPSFSAAEIYGCSYNDRQGPDDLDDAVEKWNAWMDANSTGTYLAWTFTPHYAVNNPDIDFFWMGTTADAAALGVHTDRWEATSGEAGEAFAEVADCPGHLSNMVFNIKPGAGDESYEKPVISIANCKVADGRTVDDVMAAGLQWAAYESENGMNSASFLWFPVFGHGNVDHDFRLVKVYDGGHTQLGRETAWYYGSQSWNEARQLFAGLLQCDVARVYNGTLRRYDAGPE